MTIGLFVAVNQWNSWFDAYLYTSAQSLKPMQSVLVEILNPVSYTHLDVYKRQVYDGKEMLVSSVTSPHGWKILSLVSVPMLEMNIRTSVKNVILFALLAVIMSVVFSAVISILITRRIKELTKSVEKMKDGVCLLYTSLLSAVFRMRAASMEISRRSSSLEL